MASSSLVTLVANDGVEVQATLQAVQQSITLKSMLEILDEEHTIGLPIPLPGVEGDALRNVMQWCEHYREDPAADDPFPDVGGQTREFMPAWDVEFLTFDKEMLFQVANAANYLDIPCLLGYVAATIAYNLRGKSTEEMREYLNIKNDLTPKQEKKIRKENAWVWS
ncbi:s-phase kinase-associated protein 1 [Nemania serpens]|nr:s-phase kinase-associated protein 1 [Nemania serpens]